MRLYLNGDGAGKGTHISVFIDLTGKLDSLLRWMFKHEVSLSLLGKDILEWYLHTCVAIPDLVDIPQTILTISITKINLFDLSNKQQ